jgi:hypothetical protein
VHDCIACLPCLTAGRRQIDKMFGKIKSAVKIAVAVFITPAALVIFAETVKSFFAVFININTSLSFVCGFSVYIISDLFFWRPSKSYVAAHELIHAIAAKISGLRIKKILIKSMGGYVETDAENSFVALAPYLIPVYAVLTAAIFGILLLKWDTAVLRFFATSIFGFFLAFHLINTFRTLNTRRQSDIKKGGGFVFSIVLIILVNSIIVIFAFEFLYPHIIGVMAIFKKAAAAMFDFWFFILETLADFFAVIIE